MSMLRQNSQAHIKSRPVFWHGARILCYSAIPLVLACSTSPRPGTDAPVSDSSEPSWIVQVDRVRSGAANSIHLSDRAVTDIEVAELSNVNGLETLILDAGKITDEGIASISKCPNLYHLRLRSSPISDAGIERLVGGKCASLRILNLPHAKITATGAAHLSKFPELRQLRLGGKNLDDACIAQLAKLPMLESLHLIGPRLSDSALDFIAKSPQLSSFYLDDCQLSETAWQRLFARKPNLHVHIDQHHHDRDPNKHSD